METKLVILNDHPVYKVSARQMYFFFENDPTHFGRWKRKWIDPLNSTDYQAVPILANGVAKRMIPDYMLKIDVAINICMQSKKKQGIILREKLGQYLIQKMDLDIKPVEEIKVPESAPNIAELLRKAADYITELENKVFGYENHIKQLSAGPVEQQKIEAFNTLMAKNDKYTIAKAAKILKCYRNDKELFGQKTLFSYLRQAEILRHNNEPYQKYIEYFPVTTRVIKIGALLDKEKTITQTYITSKGLERLRLRLLKEGYKFKGN